MLVSPLPNWIIVAGYVSGGVARGLAIAVVVTGVSVVFANVHVQHPAFVLTVVVLTAALFSLAGFINAMLARNYDDVSIVPTFILTPLTYLGGVFYSVDLLPEMWRNVSFANPILYMVNAMRFGVLGASDIPIATSLILIVMFIVAFAWISIYLMNRGTGIKS